MSATNPSDHRLGHIPGLDGLRGISVIVVLLYHAHLNVMIGGYLGVEIFFVISGFLITSLLLNEAAQSHGTIDLGRFWQRRFLRLLPALFAVLFFVTLLGAFVLGEKAAQFRGDIIASLLYLENWYQIYSGGSYFADQGLPLLRHIWSLAVEEQFYLIWPLLVACILRLSRGNSRPLLLITIALFAASLATAQCFTLQCDPAQDGYIERLNRIYLGTDTRAAGILLGAMLAMTNWKELVHGWRAVLAGITGFIALCGLLVCCSRLDALDLFLYRQGFLLVDVLTLLVIAALIRTEKSAFQALLSWKPLEYIGQRSYGLYLWHWPIFRLLGHGESEAPWIMARILVSLLVADISYRWLETPIRKGKLSARLFTSDGFAMKMRRVACLLTAMVLTVSLTWSGVILAQQPPYVDEVAESLRLNTVAIDRNRITHDIIAIGPPLPTAPPKVAAQPRYEAVPHPETFPIINPHIDEVITITAVGDSVMKGAAIALKKQAHGSGNQVSIYIDAEESRSFDRGYAILEDLKKAGSLGEVVVIHLGTNNSHIEEARFARLAALLADRRLVLFLTVKSDKTSICDTVNAALARYVDTLGNARLFDWKGIAVAHPELFYADQTHLRQSGAEFYAAVIYEQIRLALAPPVEAEHGPPEKLLVDQSVPAPGESPATAPSTTQPMTSAALDNNSVRLTLLIPGSPATEPEHQASRGGQ